MEMNAIARSLRETQCRVEKHAANRNKFLTTMRAGVLVQIARLICSIESVRAKRDHFVQKNARGLTARPRYANADIPLFTAQ
jgi:hypothetical protein